MSKVRRILIVTTEEKHAQLRMIKATLDMTWEELLVDFALKLYKELEAHGIEGLRILYHQDVQRRMEQKDKELKGR